MQRRWQVAARSEGQVSDLSSPRVNLDKVRSSCISLDHEVEPVQT